MKRASWLAILLIATGAGWCQAAVRIGILAGYAQPFEKVYGGGFAYGAGLSFDLHRNIALELRTVRYQYSLEGSLDGLSKGTLSVMPVEIGFKGRFPLAGEKIVPYITVGGGYSFHQFTIDPQLAAVWEKIGFGFTEKMNNAFGFHAGAGLEIVLTPGLALVLDASFRFVRSEGSWTMSDLVGGQEVSGDLAKLGQNSVVFGLGLQFSWR